MLIFDMEMGGLDNCRLCQCLYLSFQWVIGSLFDIAGASDFAKLLSQICLPKFGEVSPIIPLNRRTILRQIISSDSFFGGHCGMFVSGDLYSGETQIYLVHHYQLSDGVFCQRFGYCELYSYKIRCSVDRMCIMGRRFVGRVELTFWLRG